MDQQEEPKECREAYWTELDKDGKIERLRRGVKNLQNTVRHLMIAYHKMRDHQHLDGQLMVPLVNEYDEEYHHNRIRDSNYL